VGIMLKFESYAANEVQLTRVLLQLKSTSDLSSRLVFEKRPQPDNNHIR